MFVFLTSQQPPPKPRRKPQRCFQLKEQSGKAIQTAKRTTVLSTARSSNNTYTLATGASSLAPLCRVGVSELLQRHKRTLEPRAHVEYPSISTQRLKHLRQRVRVGDLLCGVAHCELKLMHFNLRQLMVKSSTSIPPAQGPKTLP